MNDCLTSFADLTDDGSMSFLSSSVFLFNLLSVLYTAVELLPLERLAAAEVAILETVTDVRLSADVGLSVLLIAGTLSARSAVNELPVGVLCDCLLVL